jgi:hypothetical protein
VRLPGARFLNGIDFAGRLFLSYAFEGSTRRLLQKLRPIFPSRLREQHIEGKEVARDETDIAVSEATPWVPHHIPRSCDHRELCNGAPLSARKGSNPTQLAAAHSGLGVPGSDRGVSL